MRVLVTGAAGFVGRRLLPRLADAGHAVDGSDRETDVADADALAAAIARSRPEAVVHLAARSSVAQSLHTPEACYRINYLGTRALLAGVARHAPDARVLLIGSADAYSPAEAPAEPASPGDVETRPLDEATPLRPRSPYARTKAAGELLGRLALRAGLDVICVRAFNHTGAGQSDAFVVPSFARQLAAIAQGRTAPRLRVGNLDSIRDFLHVDDVVDAYLRLLDRRVAPGVYTVARGTGVAVRSILAALCGVAGVAPEIEVDPARWRPADWLVGDPSRLRAATGWRPRIALDALWREVYADALAGGSNA